MTALIYALVLQTAYPGPENWAYVQCLIAEASAANRLPEARFEARLEAACPAEAEAIRAVIIETEEARGLDRSAAERQAERYFVAVRQSMRDLRPAR